MVLDATVGAMEDAHAAALSEHKGCAVSAEPSVTFVALHPDAVLPRRQTAGAAGHDLHSICAGRVEPRGHLTVGTGFSLSIPAGYAGVVLGRSGLGVKNGIQIKASYCRTDEELTVCLYNTGTEPFEFAKGMRIAQLVFLKTVAPYTAVEAIGE